MTVYRKGNKFHLTQAEQRGVHDGKFIKQVLLYFCVYSKINYMIEDLKHH